MAHASLRAILRTLEGRATVTSLKLNLTPFQTGGRTRQDTNRTIHVPRNDVYVYALDGRFRERLCR